MQSKQSCHKECVAIAGIHDTGWVCYTKQASMTQGGCATPSRHPWHRVGVLHRTGIHDTGWVCYTKQASMTQSGCATPSRHPWHRVGVLHQVGIHDTEWVCYTKQASMTQGGCATPSRHPWHSVGVLHQSGIGNQQCTQQTCYTVQVSKLDGARMLHWMLTASWR